MKLRLWARKSARGEKAGERSEAKRRVQGDLDRIRQTQGRANEPNQNQGLNGGFGSGTY